MIYHARMDKETEQRLVYAIALRVGTGQQIADLFGITLHGVKLFAQRNQERLERARERITGEAAPQPEAAQPTPGQLSDLWITNKYERLKRLQTIAEEMEKTIANGGMSAAELATAVRELRSYMMLAANELGQLLHRGAGDSGDGSYLSVDIQGVNMENLR